MSEHIREITPKSLAVASSAFVGATFSSLTIASIAIAVFMGPISRDYGWSHAEIGAAASLLYGGMALGALVFGRIVDRLGPRAVLLPLTALSGLLLTTFSVTGPSLPLFYGAHFLLGLSTPGAVAYSKLISSWFFRWRGLALGALGIGVFVANVGVPPLARALLQSLGWHKAYVVFGAAELLISFPVLVAFFRERNGGSDGLAAGLDNEVRPDGAPPIGVRQAWKSSVYWLLLGAQATGSFAYMALATHAVGMLGEHGVSPAAAVAGLSVFASGGLVAQVLCGLLLDRFDTPQVILPFALLSIAGIGLLYLAHAQSAALLATLVLGVGCGGQNSMTSYFTTRYFGVRNFSTIYGSLMPLLLVAAAPAPILIGAIFDSTGSYQWALGAIALALVFSAIFFGLLKPYPYPAKTIPASAPAPSVQPHAQSADAAA